MKKKLLLLVLSVCIYAGVHAQTNKIYLIITNDQNHFTDSVLHANTYDDIFVESENLYGRYNTSTLWIKDFIHTVSNAKNEGKKFLIIINDTYASRVLALIRNNKYEKKYFIANRTDSAIKFVAKY